VLAVEDLSRTDRVAGRVIEELKINLGPGKNKCLM